MSATNARLRERLAERDGPACHWCGLEDADDYHADRLDPGSGYRLDNCVLSCAACNVRRQRGAWMDADRTVSVRDAILASNYVLLPRAAMLDLAPGPLALYAWLLDYAGKDETAWPGQEALAQRIGCSERALRDYVNALEIAGYVRTFRRGRGKTTQYLLTLPKEQPSTDRQILPVMDLRPADIAAPDRQNLPPNESHGPRERKEEGSPPIVPPANANGRLRNEIWDALEDVLGWKPATRSEQARFGRACKVIREALGIAPNVYPGERAAESVRLVAAEHRKRWPTLTLTLESMVKHWSDLLTAAQARQASTARPNQFIERFAGGSR